MKIAILTTDNREHHRRYDLDAPIFGPAIEALLQGLSARPELEIHVVACTQRPMSSPEKLATNMWFHLLDVPKIGWLRTGYQGCVRALRSKLREIHPDLVHGQGTERECALGAVFSGFPNVVTILGNMREVARIMHARVGSYLWCAAKLESFALRRTDAVFCNSAYTEAVVRQLTPRTRRVPNALRGEFFEAAPPVVALGTRPTLLNIGAILPYKRQNELLDVAERLHQQGHAFEFQFIGPVDRSAYAKKFLARIQTAKSAGYARYLGAKSLPELIGILDQSAALVHSSAEESFGLVVAEALSRNLKFFGANVGGVSDIAQGVEGAELFALGDDKALTEGIVRWLQRGSPRPESAAREMELRYHPDVIARRHVELYQELIDTI